MASGRKMGYKFRIAGVFLLLLASIAALVAVAIIQDTWAFNEYTIEVNKHTLAFLCCLPTLYLLKTYYCQILIHTLTLF